MARFIGLDYRKRRLWEISGNAFRGSPIPSLAQVGDEPGTYKVPVGALIAYVIPHLPGDVVDFVLARAALDAEHNAPRSTAAKNDMIWRENVTPLLGLDDAQVKRRLEGPRRSETARLEEIGRQIAGEAKISIDDRGGTAAATDTAVLGVPYEPESVPSSSHDGPIPFEVDPDVIDRGRKGHVETLRALASAVGGHGMGPRKGTTEPMFDLAWDSGDAVYVAEVKSLTAANEIKQLRLGLGQLLDYQNLLAQRGRDIRPVLAVERKPSDSRWMSLCRRHGVQLVWPETFESLF